MLFSELGVGDVFVLRWWLDQGPVLRHYLVVRRTSMMLYVLRLEHDNHKILEVDVSTFDSFVTNNEVFLVTVYKAPVISDPGPAAPAE